MRPSTSSRRGRIQAHRHRRAREREWSPRASVPYRARPVATLRVPDPQSRFSPRRAPLSWEARIWIVLLTVGTIVALVWGWNITRVDADLIGVEDGAHLPPESTEEMVFRLAVSPTGRLDDATLTLDGIDVLDDAEVDGDRVEWTLDGPLEEGEHVIRLTVPRPILPDAALHWRFTVDGTPPLIEVPPYLEPHDIDAPVEIAGRVNDATDFRVDGEPHEVEPDGSFRIHLPEPPTGPITLSAKDHADNRRQVKVYVPLAYPDEVRGIHVTAAAWDHDGLRQGIVDLIDDGVVNTVVLSIKDEGGIVGHESDVPLADEVGATLDMYDLAEEVEYFHSRGVRVIGRVVAFRDPKLADHAWGRGDHDMVVQTPDGDRFGSYGGGFVNFAHPEVQQYNIDLAVEAVEAGVDDILYDYVRRPDGFIETMRFPGLEGEPTDAVAGFLADSHREMRQRGAVQGASVFGIAATRPEQIAQDILVMAGNTDYIAPMLYPSHWNRGEYGVPNPVEDPYEIVKRSLRDFQQQVARTGRPLVPWLQHFSLGTTYGPREIRAQIEAAADMGIDSWLMWDPAVTYDERGLRNR